MKLPPDSDIEMRKLTHYLLVPQPESDKSAWLARAGYTPLNPQRLMDDLRAQLLPLDAVLSRPTPFGEAFEICGKLVGPSGMAITVRSIWLKDALSGRTRFVTLIPAPRRPANEA